MRDWIEALCAPVIYLAACLWPVIMVVKMVGSAPLTFQWYPTVNWETWPVLVVIAVLVLALLMAVSAKVLTQDGEYFSGSHLINTYALKIFAAASLVLAVWWTAPPAGGTSVPLAAMLLLSGWSYYLVRWGFLKSHRDGESAPQERGQVERPTHKEPEEPARLAKPQLTFADIYGNDAIKSRLKEAALAITARRDPETRPRNGILLHGGPGNGKTVFAEALAGELQLPLVTLGYADVASQWVGEKSARVRQAFEQAKRHQPCVLFIDEADSFLDSRDDQAGGVKEDRDLVNALLTLMVDIRQSRVVLVAATNHIDRLDAAGIREGRFDFKVEITPPDQAARKGLLREGLRKHLPNVHIDATVIDLVAQRWNGFSVKRIMAVTEELPLYLRDKGVREPGFEDFMGALRQLQGQRGHVPENVKPLAELVLSDSTRETIAQIVGRMADPEHTERHGGTLPSGVLFYGPPGTGKTATCKALAAELGWAYLPATGAELARDAEKLEKLYSKAKDLRPAIIFIDEADELLRSREYAANTAATNKLLTLMDGVGDRVADVVWIAATNHPEQIDAALLRGGRFTEKVPFELPSAGDLACFVDAWFSSRQVQLHGDLAPGDAVALMGATSIANAEAIAQAALNRAISRRETPVVVHRRDVEGAVQSVGWVAC